MRQLYTSYKRTWRRVAAPEQVLRNGGWDRADEDLGWLTNDDVRSLTSTNKQAPAKGQRVIDVAVYKRMRCSIITRARSPRFSKVTFSLILAKSSRITIRNFHGKNPVCELFPEFHKNVTLLYLIMLASMMILRRSHVHTFRYTAY